MQLMNGLDTILLKEPLTAAGCYDPPMSRAVKFMIRSAKPETNGLYASASCYGKSPTNMLE